MSTSPTVARWELLLRLDERCKHLGMDAATVAKALKITPSYWYAIMRDERALTDERYQAILQLLSADEMERQLFDELRSLAKQRGWWSDYSALFDDDNRRLFGLEHGAQSVSSYESLLIPGLLQTEDYARAVMAADMARIRPIDAEQYIKVRMRRQERLVGEGALELNVAISEAALNQSMGPPEVLGSQLRHIAELMRIETNKLDIRIIPFGCRNRAILSGAPFHIIGFANPILPDLGWHESVSVHGIIDDPAKVRELQILFTRAHTEDALSKEDSLRLVEDKANKLP